MNDVERLKHAIDFVSEHDFGGNRYILTPSSGFLGTDEEWRNNVIGRILSVAKGGIEVKIKE